MLSRWAKENGGWVSVKLFFFFFFFLVCASGDTVCFRGEWNFDWRTKGNIQVHEAGQRLTYFALGLQESNTSPRSVKTGTSTMLAPESSDTI